VPKKNSTRLSEKSVSKQAHFFPSILILILILIPIGGRPPATKLRKAGIFSRVDDSNTSIGKRYARNDELGTPFGVTLDFACEYHWPWQNFNFDYEQLSRTER
jgi:hypothetical protein